MWNSSEISEVNLSNGYVQIILDDDSSILVHQSQIFYIPSAGMTIEYSEINGVIDTLIINEEIIYTDIEIEEEYGMAA